MTKKEKVLVSGGRSREKGEKATALFEEGGTYLAH